MRIRRTGEATTDEVLGLEWEAGEVKNIDDDEAAELLLDAEGFEEADDLDEGRPREEAFPLVDPPEREDL
jgi:hypothetical protein